ncbi:unnamed protein product [Paramecium primaurelia]|uniref:Uncharacterized protein n=1 Tax=Paramecium primaurelia TaxID=5886 RepID=A0A8S1MM37_PARPR|nr:unnamed protein product [Paramecium primaurelia]
MIERDRFLIIERSLMYCPRLVKQQCSLDRTQDIIFFGSIYEISLFLHIEHEKQQK